ncbi:MAG TPA: hypothetical protein O0X70_03725 [Methanocorpusculum sp.]|nr:hypothetical protein [Methanocorpusculum sp.]
MSEKTTPAKPDTLTALYARYREQQTAKQHLLREEQQAKSRREAELRAEKAAEEERIRKTNEAYMAREEKRRQIAREAEAKRAAQREEARAAERREREAERTRFKLLEKIDADRRKQKTDLARLQTLAAAEKDRIARRIAADAAAREAERLEQLRIAELLAADAARRAENARRLAALGAAEQTRLTDRIKADEAACECERLEKIRLAELVASDAARRKTAAARLRTLEKEWAAQEDERRARDMRLRAYEKEEEEDTLRRDMTAVSCLERVREFLEADEHPVMRSEIAFIEGVEEEELRRRTIAAADADRRTNARRRLYVLAYRNACRETGIAETGLLFPRFDIPVPYGAVDSYDIRKAASGLFSGAKPRWKTGAAAAGAAAADAADAAAAAAPDYSFTLEEWYEYETVCDSADVYRQKERELRRIAEENWEKQAGANRAADELRRREHEREKAVAAEAARWFG